MSVSEFFSVSLTVYLRCKIWIGFVGYAYTVWPIGWIGNFNRTVRRAPWANFDRFCRFITSILNCDIGSTPASQMAWFTKPNPSCARNFYRWNFLRSIVFPLILNHPIHRTPVRFLGLWFRIQGGFALIWILPGDFYVFSLKMCWLGGCAVFRVFRFFFAQFGTCAVNRGGLDTSELWARYCLLPPFARRSMRPQSNTDFFSHMGLSIFVWGFFVWGGRPQTEPHFAHRAHAPDDLEYCTLPKPRTKMERALPEAECMRLWRPAMGCKIWAGVISQPCLRFEWFHRHGVHVWFALRKEAQKSKREKSENGQKAKVQKKRG